MFAEGPADVFSLARRRRCQAGVQDRPSWRRGKYFEKTTRRAGRGVGVSKTPTRADAIGSPQREGAWGV